MSSRSTSFSLPNEARETITLEGRQPGDEVEFGEEMDEESELSCDVFVVISRLSLGAHRIGVAAAKHAAFVRARGRHYSNEAEAMKVRSLCVCSIE